MYQYFPCENLVRYTIWSKKPRTVSFFVKIKNCFKKQWYSWPAVTGAADDRNSEERGGAAAAPDGVPRQELGGLGAVLEQNWTPVTYGIKKNKIRKYYSLHNRVYV